MSKERSTSRFLVLCRPDCCPEEFLLLRKAFEGTFQKAKWITFETEDGQVIVEFNGPVTM